MGGPPWLFAQKPQVVLLLHQWGPHILCPLPRRWAKHWRSPQTIRTSTGLTHSSISGRGDRRITPTRSRFIGEFANCPIDQGLSPMPVRNETNEPRFAIVCIAVQFFQISL